MVSHLCESEYVCLVWLWMEMSSGIEDRGTEPRYNNSSERKQFLISGVKEEKRSTKSNEPFVFDLILLT